MKVKMESISLECKNDKTLPNFRKKENVRSTWFRLMVNVRTMHVAMGVFDVRFGRRIAPPNHFLRSWCHWKGIGE